MTKEQHEALDRLQMAVTLATKTGLFDEMQPWTNGNIINTFCDSLEDFAESFTFRDSREIEWKIEGGQLFWKNVDGRWKGAPLDDSKTQDLFTYGKMFVDAFQKGEWKPR